jgi:threonine dehydrogenase-like Zn-dependent dehydrogenase
MLKAAITGERRAELVEVPDPQPSGNLALVKVHAAPMCAEYKGFIAGQKGAYLGHEAAGEVVAVDTPGKVKVGDRVVVMPTYPCGACPLCTSGDYIHCEEGSGFSPSPNSPEGSATMAQYLLKNDWILLPIPDGVSYERASLACCALGPSFGAFQRMGVDAFTTVLITGAGPVGLGALVNAKYRGARAVVAEGIPWRARRAEEMGADLVVDPTDPDALKKVKAFTGGTGVDCALDCSGNVKAERFCIDAARRKGKVAFVGECGDDLKIRVSPDLIRKGLTVMGSWHYNLNEFPKIMRVIQTSPLIPQLVSHVFPMSRIQEAFETSASNETAKVLLKPWE